MRVFELLVVHKNGSGHIQDKLARAGLDKPESTGKQGMDKPEAEPSKNSLGQLRYFACFDS